MDLYCLEERSCWVVPGFGFAGARVLRDGVVDRLSAGVNVFCNEPTVRFLAIALDFCNVGECTPGRNLMALFEYPRLDATIK